MIPREITCSQALSITSCVLPQVDRAAFTAAHRGDWEECKQLQTDEERVSQSMKRVWLSKALYEGRCVEICPSTSGGDGLLCADLRMQRVHLVRTRAERSDYHNTNLYLVELESGERRTVDMMHLERPVVDVFRVTVEGEAEKKLMKALGPPESTTENHALRQWGRGQMLVDHACLTEQSAEWDWAFMQMSTVTVVKLEDLLHLIRDFGLGEQDSGRPVPACVDPYNLSLELLPRVESLKAKHRLAWFKVALCHVLSTAYWPLLRKGCNYAAVADAGTPCRVGAESIETNLDLLAYQLRHSFPIETLLFPSFFESTKEQLRGRLGSCCRPQVADVNSFLSAMCSLQGEMHRDFQKSWDSVAQPRKRCGKDAVAKWRVFANAKVFIFLDERRSRDALEAAGEKLTDSLESRFKNPYLKQGAARVLEYNEYRELMREYEQAIQSHCTVYRADYRTKHALFPSRSWSLVARDRVSGPGRTRHKLRVGWLHRKRYLVATLSRSSCAGASSLV